MFMCTYLIVLTMSNFSTSVSAVQLQFDGSISEKMALNGKYASALMLFS